VNECPDQELVVVVEATTLVVVVPGKSVVVVVGTLVVVVDRVVLVLEVVVLDGATPGTVVVVLGLETCGAVVVGTALVGDVVIGGVVVGGTPIVVVVVGCAKGTGGPIPLVREGGFVVGTGTVGTGTVGTGALVVGDGAVVVGVVAVGVVAVGVVAVGAAVVGAAVVGVVAVGGAYLGAAVVGGVEVGGVVVRVVRAVVEVCGGVVVELVEPVAGPGTSACAVRVIEPKALLSLAFWASSLLARSVWRARSSLSAAIAAVSLAVDACVASAVGGFPKMAFEARSMYCLALAESCLARYPLAYCKSTWTSAWLVAGSGCCTALERAAPPTTPITRVTAAATSNLARSRRLAPRTAKAAARTSVRPPLGSSGSGGIDARSLAARSARSSVGARRPARRWACVPWSSAASRASARARSSRSGSSAVMTSSVPAASRAPAAAAFERHLPFCRGPCQRQLPKGRSRPATTGPPGRPAAGGQSRA
jgi:hypothetical protein